MIYRAFVLAGYVVCLCAAIETEAWVRMAFALASAGWVGEFAILTMTARKGWWR